MAHNNILIVDDEKRQREILELILSSEGYKVSTAASGEAALRMVRSERFDLVLTDLKMTGMSGLELLKNLVQVDSSIIVVLMTAHGSIDSAKEAIRFGAYEYLEKPLDQAQLLAVVSKALDRLNVLDGEIIGSGDQMERLKKLVLKVAASDETVLVRGESGTGKELIARALHKNSPRTAQVFQAVNCAAINENLLESELFGHEKGSFTGAYTEKKGLFETADKGTLFLDEIGELNINLQAKLLRALQEGEIQRVGATRPIKIDVRVVAATNRDLEAMVKEGKFREDLYYRLNVIPVNVPPLRARRTDISVLANYFLRKQARGRQPELKFSPEAMRFLQDYAWPGNVRQLESAVKRAVLLSEGDRIEVEDLPVEIRQTPERAAEFQFKLPPEGISFEDLEQSLIVQAMEQTDWNITRAAKLLGLTFRTLQYRLEKFNLKRPGRGETDVNEVGE